MNRENRLLDILTGITVPRLVLLGLLAAPLTASAVTIDVTTVTDKLLATGGAGCSLGEAITNANDNAVTYSECVVGEDSVADIINIPAGTYTISLTGADEDFNATGDFDFTDTAGITIQGAGAATTIIDGQGTPTVSTDRVFHATFSDISIDGVAIQNGSVIAASRLDPSGGGFFFADLRYKSHANRLFCN